MEGFDYVVKPPEIPRVAFGSSLERETLPLRGPSLTSFMRKHQGDVFLSPGPTAWADERDYLEIKYASKFGYTAFASKYLRLPPAQTTNYPCVGNYELDLRKPVKPANKPFNIGAPRQDTEKFLTPAPSSYPFHVPRPQLKITSAFGSQHKISPVVTVICSPLNIANCHKCDQCPNGDYWHNFITNLDLCRPCMHKIELKLKSCKRVSEIQRLRMRRESMNYQLVRYCGFYHDHNGTTAATQLISNFLGNDEF